MGGYLKHQLRGKKVTENIRAELQKKMEVCREQAEKCVARYWAVKEMHRHDRLGPGRFGCRLRVRGPYLSLGWFRVRRRYSQPGRNNQRGEFEHIRKGKGYRYRDRGFGGALDWEWALITVTEDEFARIRRTYAALTEAQRWCRQFDALPVPDPSAIGRDLLPPGDYRRYRAGRSST